MKVTKNVDLNKYGYIGCGFGFDAWWFDNLMHDARCETIDTSNIVDINKYLMDKHNIVEILLF